MHAGFNPAMAAAKLQAPEHASKNDIINLVIELLKTPLKPNAPGLTEALKLFLFSGNWFFLRIWIFNHRFSLRIWIWTFFQDIG